MRATRTGEDGAVKYAKPSLRIDLVCTSFVPVSQRLGPGSGFVRLRRREAAQADGRADRRPERMSH